MQNELEELVWVPVSPVPDTLVVNIGDMLEIWTQGRYKATPHRVRFHPISLGEESAPSRLSIPFFFDPSFEAVIDVLPGESLTGGRHYEHKSNITLPIRYGDYITAKVAKCFPSLAESSHILEAEEKK